jgi:predicted AlkP superfamily pyrophosphatase or phosphodiesterase
MKTTFRLKYLCWILLLTSTVSYAQKTIQQPRKPKLVVGIVVDQMRADYIDKYWNKFGDGGFKKLVKNGFDCRNTNYNYMPTYTGPGHASIYSGTTPAYHGIVGNDWYERTSGDTVYCAGDTSVSAVGSSSDAGKMSPHRLLTTTITDELQLTTQQASKVIGISLKDRGAILPAGRSADAAYWYDGKSGNWITSSWYMTSLPKWINDFNDRRWPEQYLSKAWNTVLPIREYTVSNPDDNPYEAPFKGEEKPVFPHNLPALRGKSFELVRRTPFGNTMTKDLGIAAIVGEKMGDDSIPDFLCMSFSATDYVGHQFGPSSVEVEDTYIRLDRDMADLLNFLDNQIGKGKYLIFLTADHGAVENVQFLLDQKLEGGYANPTEVDDTIKYFLKANYGKSDYFINNMNDQIYLDHDKIAADKIDLCKLEYDLSNFLKFRIDGLLDVITGCNLDKVDYTEPFKSKIQNGYLGKRSGDLALLFAPGWTEKLYGNGKQGTTHGTAYPYDTHVPLLWYGWHINAGSTVREIQITDIAPTLSFLLHVGIPNGCTGHVIPEIAK